MVRARAQACLSTERNANCSSARTWTDGRGQLSRASDLCRDLSDAPQASGVLVVAACGARRPQLADPVPRATPTSLSNSARPAAPGKRKQRKEEYQRQQRSPWQSACTARPRVCRGERATPCIIQKFGNPARRRTDRRSRGCSGAPDAGSTVKDIAAVQSSSAGRQSRRSRAAATRARDPVVILGRSTRRPR